MKQVILVTGASSGIGKATAQQLIAEGHMVYGAARRTHKMQDLADSGGHVLEMDVTKHDQIKKGVEQIIKEQGRIDVLVNNAGYALYGPVEETTYEQAKRQFDVNLFGLAEVTKAVLPQMRQQQSGKIVNIASVGGKIYSPLGSWYHATKHALEGWSDCLRIELKQFGIDVAIVEPGLILTEFDQAMDNPYGHSNGSPYKGLIDAMGKSTAESYTPAKSSPPEVIAQVISKIVRSKKIKTRYVAGKMAKQVLFARRWFSDKSFDKMILGMVKKMAQ